MGKELIGKKTSYCSKECRLKSNGVYYRTVGVIKNVIIVEKNLLETIIRKYCSNECSTLKRNRRINM